MNHVQPHNQFGLRAMLVFMFAASVYLSTMSSLSLLWVERSPIWRVELTMFVGWALLLGVYREWRLREAATVHYSGLVGVLVPCLLIGLPVLAIELRTWNEAKDVFAGFVGVTAYACGWGLAVSFPVSILMLVVRSTHDGVPASPTGVVRAPTRDCPREDGAWGG